MGQVINLKDITGFDRSKRTVKVTLCSLALAIEYFTLVKPDKAFVKEARSCLRGHDTTNEVRVTESVKTKVMNETDFQDAIKKCLLG